VSHQTRHYTKLSVWSKKLSVQPQQREREIKDNPTAVDYTFDRFGLGVMLLSASLSSSSSSSSIPAVEQDEILHQ